MRADQTGSGFGRDVFGVAGSGRTRPRASTSALSLWLLRVLSRRRGSDDNAGRYRGECGKPGVSRSGDPAERESEDDRGEQGEGRGEATSILWASECHESLAVGVDPLAVEPEHAVKENTDATRRSARLESSKGVGDKARQRPSARTTMSSQSGSPRSGCRARRLTRSWLRGRKYRHRSSYKPRVAQGRDAQPIVLVTGTARPQVAAMRRNRLSRPRSPPGDVPFAGRMETPKLVRVLAETLGFSVVRSTDASRASRLQHREARVETCRRLLFVSWHEVAVSVVGDRDAACPRYVESAFAFTPAASSATRTCAGLVAGQSASGQRHARSGCGAQSLRDTCGSRACDASLCASARHYEAVLSGSSGDRSAKAERA